MPWTFSHSAAVLPLRRASAWGLPFIGLVVGSMSPDFAYHLWRYDVGRFAHTPLGLVLMCVPQSTLLVLLLVKCRGALADPLPQPHRGAIERLPSPDVHSLRGLLLLMLATFIGALTHAVWDSFTHAYGFAVRNLALLRADVGGVGGHMVHVYSILQHASSVIGLALVVVSYATWVRAQPLAPSDPVQERRRWGRLAACAVLSAAVGSGLAALVVPVVAQFRSFVVSSVIFATDLFVVSYLVLAWTRSTRRSAT
jgi:hypothetical protein